MSAFESRATVLGGRMAAVVGLTTAGSAPFWVHQLPEVAGKPAGAFLLPMFYAPLFLVGLGYPVGGLAAGLILPVCNNWLLGLPIQSASFRYGIELAVFTGTATVFWSRTQRKWLVGILAFGAGRSGIFLYELTGATGRFPAQALEHLTSSFLRAIPGLLVLAIFGVVAARVREL